jgi:hypothetical protein
LEDAERTLSLNIAQSTWKALNNQGKRWALIIEDEEAPEGKHMWCSGDCTPDDLVDIFSRALGICGNQPNRNEGPGWTLN